MVKKIDHIGIVVKDVEQAAKFYSEQLGIPVSRIVEMPGDGAKIAFIRIGEVDIELLEPLSPESGLQAFIERRGEGLHHICLEVDDISAELKRLGEQGVPLVDKVPRTGASAGMIGFLHPKASNGVLIELNQKD